MLNVRSHSHDVLIVFFLLLQNCLRHAARCFIPARGICWLVNTAKRFAAGVCFAERNVWGSVPGQFYHLRVLVVKGNLVVLTDDAALWKLKADAAVFEAGFTGNLADILEPCRLPQILNLFKLNLYVVISTAKENAANIQGMRGSLSKCYFSANVHVSKSKFLLTKAP